MSLQWPAKRGLKRTRGNFPGRKNEEKSILCRRKCRMQCRIISFIILFFHARRHRSSFHAVELPRASRIALRKAFFLSFNLSMPTIRQRNMHSFAHVFHILREFAFSCVSPSLTRDGASEFVATARRNYAFVF